MRDYQLAGLNWLVYLYKNNINGILADEMGLGKTIQTISLLGYIKHHENQSEPNIIVCPKSILQNWLDELSKWCPSIKTTFLIGTKMERKSHIKNFLKSQNWDVLITTYEVCRMEKAYISSVKWSYVVVDEGHKLKNVNTQVSQVMNSLESKHRLILTGTPINNNLEELWVLLNFLLPDIFKRVDYLHAWINTNNFISDKNKISQLKDILEPFMLRRIKIDVEKSLLPKKELQIVVSLSKMQKELMNNIINRNLTMFTGAGKLTYARLANIFVQLRKGVNHPYLFPGIEPEPFTTDYHLVASCGKMKVLDKLLHRLKERGSRVLIFSQFVIMCDIIVDYLEWRNYDYCYMHGNTSKESRDSQIAEFNREGSPKFVFVLTTRTGGLGINLNTADAVIIYDCDWNPQADNQAIDRAHRIGQKKQVCVFRLITENTVEERMEEISKMKMKLGDCVVEGNSKL